MSARIKGNPALLDTGKLTCMWAGTIEITNPGQKTMKEGCTPLNYYADLIQSEAKAKDVKVAVRKAEELEVKVEALTVKDFAEVLKRIERKKKSYEAARYYAAYHIDYWKLTKLARRYADEIDAAKKEEEKDNDPNLMPSRYMLLYGADDGKLRGQGNLDTHRDGFEGKPEHELSVANLRKALILMGYEVEDSGPYDEPLFWAHLNYLRRFGRAEWDFVQEDKGDSEKPLDAVAARYGLATWKCFYGEECGAGDGSVEHKRVLNKINSTYGDELLKEKGGVPHDYRSCLCYRYPWVPFSLTINRGDEEGASVEKDEDKEVQYRIYDGKREALVAEGEVVDDKIEDLFPDIENPVVFIDGERIWLRAEQPDVSVEAGAEEDDGEKRIIRIYWAYWNGEKYIELKDTSRHYVDSNILVETENYDDGETVDVEIKNEDGRPLFDKTLELKLSGVVSDNKVVFKDVFREYTLDHCLVGGE